MKIWDSEGNEFTIMGGVKDGLSLRGEAGDKEISIHDLKFYKGYPPEQYEAMEQLQAALISGEITIEEIRKYRKENL